MRSPTNPVMPTRKCGRRSSASVFVHTRLLCKQIVARLTVAVPDDELKMEFLQKIAMEFGCAMMVLSVGESRSYRVAYDPSDSLKEAAAMKVIEEGVCARALRVVYRH